MDINGSLIGKGTSIEGTLSFSGSLRIDGNVKGSIHGGSGRLVISETGIFEGKAESERIEVRGRFEGQAKAGGIFVYAPGILSGSADGDSVFVEDGAQIVDL